MALKNFADWKYPDKMGLIKNPVTVCGHGCSVSSCKPSCSPSCGGSGCGENFLHRQSFGGRRKSEKK